MKQILLGGPNGTVGTAISYNGIAGFGTWQTVEINVRMEIPVEVVMRNLRVDVTTAPSASTSRTFTVRDDAADTALTVTLAATETTATDAVNEITIAAGSVISLKSTVTGSPTATNAFWSVEIEPTAAGIAIGSHALGGTPLSTSAVRYIRPGFNIGPIGPTATEEQTTFRAGINATLTEIHVTLSTALADDGSSYTFQLRKNGGDEGGAVVVLDGAEQADAITGLSVDIAPTDEFAVSVTPAGTPVAAHCTIAFVYTPDTDGESILSGATTDDVNAATTEYNFGFGRAQGSWDASAERRSLSGPTSWELRDFHVWVDVAPGVGNTETYTMMNSASALTSEAVITGAATDDEDTVNTDTITDGMLLRIRHVPTSTPTVSGSDPQWTAVQFIPVGTQSIHSSGIHTSTMFSGGIN